MKADASGRQHFTVVVGYECYGSGVRALELHHRLLARWSDSLDVQLIVWKFEPLGIPSLLAKATEDAIHADLIVISLSGKHALPAEATDWIARWRGKTVNEPAVALLLEHAHQDNTHARQILTLLADVARAGGLQFFSSANCEQSSGAAHRNLERHYESTDLLKAALRPDECLDHWGLNE